MRKPFLHKMTASLLSISLLLSMAPAAFASVALGDDIHSSAVQLGAGTSLVHSALWSNYYSDLRQEQYIVYSPNSSVSPVVSFGGHMTKTATLSASAQALEAEGYRVVAAVNGDFFDTSTGVPIGLVITNGILRTSAPAYTYALGFRADGSAFIGQPNLTTTLQTGDLTLPVSSVNKVRGKEGISLFTPDFSATTCNTEAGVDVVLRVLDDSPGLALGKPLIASVEQIFESTGAIPIEQGRIVLSVNAKDTSGALAFLRTLQIGQQVSITASTEDPVWNEAKCAIGALYKLVTAKNPVQHTDSTSAPRTAAGLRPDGTLLIYTIDGRQSGYSIGATLSQVAQRLIELGCEEAICLDGGGSTAIGGTMPGSETFRITNKPSESKERALSNSILFVAPKTEIGSAASLYLPANGTLLLSGAALPLSALAIDANCRPAALPSGLSFTATGSGIVAGSVFKAGSSGTAQISAQAGQIAGTAQVTVIGSPDRISVFEQDSGAAVTELTVAPGKSMDLGAAAKYKNLTLVAQDNCFTWSLDGNAGSISEDGFFTASPQRGSGTLTVRAGSFAVSLPVRVESSVFTLADFENDFSDILGDGDTASATAETRADRVQRGHRSLRAAYDLTSAGRSVVPASLALPAAATHLSAWVYGDGSGNTLGILTGNASGAETLTALGSLDFDGWRPLTAELPSDAVSFYGFEIQAAGKKSSGTLWFDHITAANGDFADNTAPILSVSRNETNYSADLYDDMDGYPKPDAIELTFDGQPLSFSYDEQSGRLSAALPVPDGQTHIVTLTVRDRSGNLARSSLEIPQTASVISVLSDISGHWAQPYADYLFSRGIVTGTRINDRIVYQPDKAMTRSEFAVIMTRFLGVDPSLYQDVALPFQDAASIADWALPAARAMYALGIIQGSSENGKLLFKPSGTITRAEAMTIIGRTMEKGYLVPPLSFNDSASVPAWALPYVEVLSGLGVVGGYQNNIMPSGELTKGAVAKILTLLS